MQCTESSVLGLTGYSQGISQAILVSGSLCGKESASQLTQVVDKISIPCGGITKGPGFLLALSYGHPYIPEAILNS